jgi:hypothetical protein
MHSAAEIVEAIDDPQRQQQHGWDLSRWRYDLVPWGVRFTYREPDDARPVEVLALLSHAGRHPREGADRPPSASTVLLLG